MFLYFPFHLIQFWTAETSLQRGPDRPISRSPKKPPTVSVKEPVRVQKPLVPWTLILSGLCCSFCYGVCKLVTITWIFKWGIQVNNHQMGYQWRISVHLTIKKHGWVINHHEGFGIHSCQAREIVVDESTTKRALPPSIQWSQLIPILSLNTNYFIHTLMVNWSNIAWSGWCMGI